MAIDNDLSALLPEPPPARPARREAAIEEALRRFDGGGEQAAPPRAHARPTPKFEGWGRPQIAALASVALVMLVTVPIWWAEKDRFDSGAPQAPPPAAQAPSSAAPAPTPRASPQTVPASPSPAQAELADRSPPADRFALPVAEGVPPPPAPAAVQSLPDSSGAALARRAPPPPPPPPPPPAPRARQAAPSAASEDRSIVVTGSRVTRQDFNSNSPAVSVDEALLEQGTSASHAYSNNCTILDQSRDLSSCRAQGASGRANAQLSDGLALAWRGQLDRAIDAFDRAIRADPNLSIAYLNRGLTYQAKGNLRRALADLDRAVAREPDNPRGYYYRSLLQRARGDAARAEADAARAIELDPGYEAVLP